MANHSSNLSTQSDVEIAADGDVILLVGPEQTRMRVYSQCLFPSSRFFSALFGPNWKEGQTLQKLKTTDSYAPLQISLDEDSPVPMATVLTILHNRGHQIPENLAPHEILDIAVVCAKYDLAPALKYYIKHWARTDSRQVLELGYLVTAAWLFRDQDMFTRQTLSLITHVSSSYMELLKDEDIRQFLPVEVICHLEQRRTAFKADLGHIIVAGSAKKLCGCTRGYRDKNKANARKWAFESLLAQFGMTGTSDSTVEDIVKGIEKVPRRDELLEKVIDHCYYANGAAHEPTRYRDSFPPKLEAMKKRAAICLQCVHGHEECKFQHTTSDDASGSDDGGSGDEDSSD